MITNIKIKSNSKEESRLLFKEIKKIKQVNILFGGNGVGKTTLLNGIINQTLQLENNNDIIIMKYINHIDNVAVCKDLIPNPINAIRKLNCSQFSEGQSIVNNFLYFIQDIKEIADRHLNETVVICIDEMDSGLSAENINLLITLISDLVLDYKNLQFFISSNHYHYIYLFESVINMYNGEWISIKSYEDYFKILSESTSKMMDIKGDYNFIETYIK